MKVMIIALCTLAAVMAAHQAGADEARSPAAARDSVRDIVFGWTEIPRSVIQTTKSTGNPLWGLTVGTLKGIGKAFPRTVGGLSDLTSRNHRQPVAGPSL